MTRVAFLWHMHQPYYEDLVTREHILPWARLHALKDYYGMVRLLEEFPDVRVTFNLVPSLLVQLEAFAEGRAHDRYLETGLKPADSLAPDDVAFLLRNFFHAQRHRMIDRYPRYADLQALRGVGLGPSDLESAARRFTIDDRRDLQVWQKLAWLDPYYLDQDPRVQGLLEKGRQFSEDDKSLLRTIELELLNAVIPAYRDRAAAGQIEISTSPFYHPILPLLCDTDVYKRTHPESPMPQQRFQHPDDALEQLERAARCHERLLGRRPVGLWPSEGSVSDAMIPLVAKAGFEWMATDELILAKTLGTAFTRDAGGHVDQARVLYSAYRVGGSDAQVACGFRDHRLSDLIGFAYAGWAPDAAAEDFVAHLSEGGRRAQAQNGGEEPTIFVILDGENAWEHFEGGGRPFLRSLYGRLSKHPELRTVTMSDACRPTSGTLPSIFPGSWIDANFYIWIGHRDDRTSWSQLAAAREALDEPADVDAIAHARAREEVLIAEGSDWFWWYGDDHSSDHDLEFDDLFRRHLRNVYRLLNHPVPDELFTSNITVGTPVSAQLDPSGLISPTIDGEESSYFEWLGAGDVEIREVAGAMHEADRRQILTRIRFGFDAERLYVRLDGTEPLADLLADGYALGLTFLRPEGLRLAVSLADGVQAAGLWNRTATAEPWTRKRFGGRVAAGNILELAIPLGDLGEGLSAVSFVATTSDRTGAEIERHPAAHPIELRVPDMQFDARNWTA